MYFRAVMELAGLLAIDDALQTDHKTGGFLHACLAELQHGRWLATGDFLRHYPKATYSGENEFRIPVYPGRSLDVQCNFPLNLCRIIRLV